MSHIFANLEKCILISQCDVFEDGKMENATKEIENVTEDEINAMSCAPFHKVPYSLVLAMKTSKHYLTFLKQMCAQFPLLLSASLTHENKIVNAETIQEVFDYVFENGDLNIITVLNISQIRQRFRLNTTSAFISFLRRITLKPHIGLSPLVKSYMYETFKLEQTSLSSGDGFVHYIQPCVEQFGVDFCKTLCKEQGKCPELVEDLYLSLYHYYRNTEEGENIITTFLAKTDLPKHTVNEYFIVLLQLWDGVDQTILSTVLNEQKDNIFLMKHLFPYITIPGNNKKTEMSDAEKKKLILDFAFST